MGSMQVTMETLRMCEQCVPGAPSDFSSAWNEANYDIYTFIYSSSRNTYLILYFTVEAPMSNKRPPPIFGEKSCVGLIALELAPTVDYWFKG